ncbi:hypothetical protein AX17_004407 [Amanita inopinata Kibby_2008]|nr:hypothetical protein AX17_004407 [Amanita inopinata Kibby_2008]
MPVILWDQLVTDDLTILLSLIAATVFLLNNLYKPQPLVHPILLGRQSDVGRARNPGESAVYRNYGTGLMGRFPARPNKDVTNILELVKPEVERARTLWSTKITNSQLQDRVAAFGTGLVRFAGLRPRESRVLLLLNDSLGKYSYKFVVTDLALASLSITSYTLSSISILSAVLDTYPTSTIIVHAEFLDKVLDVIYKTKGQPSIRNIVVAGEIDPQVTTRVASNIHILQFSEVERDGHRVDKIVTAAPRASDVFTVLFRTKKSGELEGIQFTHENMTAGVAAVRALLPSSNNFSILDTVVSGHSLNTAYGRVIAYTALFEGTSFATLAKVDSHASDQSQLKMNLSVVTSYESCSIPSPTVLFIKPGHLEALVSRIHAEASKSFLYSIALRHKLSGIAEGFISKESLWDRLVFDGARAKVIGEGAGTLRSVIVSDGLVNSTLQMTSRITLSVPLVHCFTHGTVAGPVFATHPFDLQVFPSKDLPCAHVGPPSVNVEAKLTGVEDEAVENGGDPTGTLLVRGPSVGRVLEEGVDGGRWTETGTKVRVQTNGAFQIIRAGDQ